MRKMDQWMNNMFGEFEPVTGRLLPAGTGEDVMKTVTPYIDLQEMENKILVTADVPGIEKEDITVNIHADMLEITAQKKKEKEEKGEGYLRRERGYTKFYRRIALPCNVNPDKVDAALKDGVLTVEMEKMALPGVKKIDIK
ncbi:MAG: Hsp20/alpha crystallin family protein [Euryarchaeota archaeon]|nr:Hsp20/alpha crystallin family protein [Euryarchaeota archaeon]